MLSGPSTMVGALQVHSSTQWMYILSRLQVPILTLRLDMIELFPLPSIESNAATFGHRHFQWHSIVARPLAFLC